MNLDPQLANSPRFGLTPEQARQILGTRFEDRKETPVRVAMPAVDSNPPTSSGPNYSRMWEQVVLRKWWIVLVAVLAAVVSFLAVSAVAPTYRSSATVLVESGKSRVISVDNVREGGDSRELYYAQVQVLQSRKVAEDTVRALKLQDLPEYGGGAKTASLGSKVKAMLGVGAGKAPPTEDERVQAATDILISKLKVEALRMSLTIKLTIDSTDPVLAAKIVNEMVSQYIGADRTGRVELASSVGNLLKDRLDGLRANLAKSEKALQDYREKKKLIGVGTSSQSLANQDLVGSSDRLAMARAKRAELESAYRQVQAAGAGGVGNLPAVQRDLGVVDALKRLSEVQAKYAEARERLGSAHSIVTQLASQVQEAQDEVNRRGRAVAAGIQVDYQAARATEESLSRLLDQSRNRASDVNRDEFQLVELQREADSNRQLYDMFVKRQKETSVAAEVQPDVARVIDPAVPALQAVGPKVLPVTAIATVLAAVLAMAYFAIRSVLRATVDKADDTASQLQLETLCSVPALPGKSPAELALMLLDAPNSLFAEAILTARTKILMSHATDERQVLLVTSSVQGEGKTTVAMSLALAHSMVRRTLLIEGDHRRPSLGKVLGYEPDADGLSNAIAGASGTCVHKVPTTDLFVMPVGSLPPNPLNLFLSKRFIEVMDILRAQFDVIIIDSPPVSEVSDALVLSQHATGVVFVVKSGGTSSNQVQESVAAVRKTGAPVLGVVLNGVDPQTLPQSRYVSNQPAIANNPTPSEARAAEPAPAPATTPALAEDERKRLTSTTAAMEPEA